MLDNELDELLNDTPSATQHEDHRKRKSLGRGLEALMGSLDNDINMVEAETKDINTINVEKIIPGKYQPRMEFDQEALQALAESIKEKGVLQPLLVRRQQDKYEIIAGERRWRASKIAGLKEVPVIIKELSDQEVLEAALVENILRENLSAIEEAEGYQRLINEFSHTQEALSQIVGKSRSHIANTLRLLGLPQSIRDMIQEGKLSAGHARALVGLDNAEELASEIIKKDNQNFPYNKIVKKFKNTNRDISISDEYIWEDLLELQYGTGNTFLVLSLLYPWIDFKNKFHIDHIFPKSLFTVKKLQKRDYDEDTIDFYLEKVNNIANLQILDETFNKEKSDTEFDKWIKHVYSATIKRKNYKEKHYIPDVDLSFDNFEEFIEERKNLLFEVLKKELQ